uniref:LOW QUALITY PROTEIN: polycystin-1-like protein 3 n=1 Tax=Pogona vitticeps TaxID=103695 RepID=A0ABM5EUS6_9SAUR
MEQPLWMWLVLSVGVCVAQGAPEPPCPLRGEEACYQVVQRLAGFQEAHQWCERHQARLLHAWDHRTQELLQGHLELRTSIWIDSGAQAPHEHGHHRHHHGGLPHGCKALLRTEHGFLATTEACSQKLFFVCESDLPNRIRRDMVTSAHPVSPGGQGRPTPLCKVSQVLLEHRPATGRGGGLVGLTVSQLGWANVQKPLRCSLVRGAGSKGERVAVAPHTSPPSSFCQRSSCRQLTCWRNRAETTPSLPGTSRPPATDPPRPSRAETLSSIPTPARPTHPAPGTQPLRGTQPGRSTAWDEPLDHQLGTSTRSQSDTPESTPGLPSEIGTQVDGHLGSESEPPSTNASPPGPGSSPRAAPTDQSAAGSTTERPTPSPPPPWASFTFRTQEGLPPEASRQMLEETLSDFNRAVQTSQEGPQGLEEAAERLKLLTSTPALLSKDAQASATHSLLSLSSRLPTVPPGLLAAGTARPSSEATAAASQALFGCFSNLLQAMNESSGEQQQEPAALEETLSALPLIQRGLLLGRSSVSAVSPMLSTSLSRCSAPSLPLSSFHLHLPKAMSVTFPSASALAPVLGKHRKVLVQVACFAFNPFRQLDGKRMKSVANVALAAHPEEPLPVQNLTEEIEIALEGDAEMGEPSRVSLNASARMLDIVVNVTSLEDALLVSVRPNAPLQITVRLSAHPDGSHELLNTTLPRAEWQQDGAYVWVIPPENFRHGLGTYYFSAGMPSQVHANVTLSVDVISAGCYYWARQHQAWRTDGCRVGPQSTLNRTQCLCSHLSFFGRVVIILPHIIRLQHMGLLLSRVGQNPTGLALLGSLLLAYGAAFLWARWKQRADVGKVRVTILAENDPTACHLYLVQVFTGYRRGASTSAQVILTLYGTEGRSRPRLLGHPQAPSFERGGMDAFLLTTRRSLGNLHAVRLWHDNAGSHPSWFVCQVVVHDLHTGKRWYFLCDSWLASDMDDGQVDKVFVIASEKERLSFRHLFWEGLVQKVTQEHLWLSVVTCSPWSPFSRIQRLSCCLALLLCSMLINIMFWKEPQEDNQQTEAPFMVTWQELVVSVEATLLLLPLQLLIVHIFQMVHAPVPEPSPATAKPWQPGLLPKSVTSLTHVHQELMETLGFLYKNRLCQHRDVDGFPNSRQNVPELVAFLCDLVSSHLQHSEDPEAPVQERSCNLHSYLCHVVKDLEAQLRRLDWDTLPRPYDHLHAADQLHKLWQNLEQQQQRQQPSPHPSAEETWPHRCCCCCFCPPRASPRQRSLAVEGPAQGPPPPLFCRPLPRRFGIICWAVLGTLSLIAGFFTLLYSLRMDRNQAGHWAVTILLSTLQNVFLMQPLKVLALTGVFSLMRKETWEDKGVEQQLRHMVCLLTEKHLRPESPGWGAWAGPLHRPPPLQPSARPTERALKEKKLFLAVREIAVQLAFLAVLMVLSYTERGVNEFYLSDTLQKSFAYELDSVATPEDLYSWAGDTLLPAVYRDAQGEAPKRRWESRSAHLRWLPSLKSFCLAAKLTFPFLPSEMAMDGNAFLVGSVRLRQIRTAAVAPPKPGPFVLLDPDEGKETAPSWGPSSRRGGAHETVWVYQSETTLQEYPIWGKMGLYPGSGYVADLGTNASHAARVLRYLERNKWLDRHTQAIFVEFVVYNVNVNLFCVVTLILENNGLGALLNKVDLQILHLYPNVNTIIPMACAHIAFLLFLLYYLLAQGQRLVRQRLGYFRSKGNLLDAGAVLIGVAIVGLYVKRTLLAESILRQHRQNRHQFISFYGMAEVDSALTYLIAFLLALTTVKLWNLLRLSPRMYLITQTLQKAWDEVMGFLLVLLVLLAGYSIVCNLLFGWSIYDYKTFFDSAVTIVGLLIGIFDYEEVIALDPVLGSILISTSIISMVFVIINLFVSVLLTVFGREMKAAKASKEESMMQLIQLKLSLLLGIKQRAQQAEAPGPGEGQAASCGIPPPVK